MYQPKTTTTIVVFSRYSCVNEDHYQAAVVERGNTSLARSLKNQRTDIEAVEDVNPPRITKDITDSDNVARNDILEGKKTSFLCQISERN